MSKIDWPNHARKMGSRLSSELPNGVRNTLDGMADRIEQLERLEGCVKACGFDTLEAAVEYLADKHLFPDRMAKAAARAEQLEAALRFYGATRQYKSSTVYMCGHSGKLPIEFDGGKRARQALQETSDE